MKVYKRECTIGTTNAANALEFYRAQKGRALIFFCYDCDKNKLMNFEVRTLYFHGENLHIPSDVVECALPEPLQNLINSLVMLYEGSQTLLRQGA